MKIANDKIKIGAAYIRYSSSMQSEGFSAEAQEHQIRDRAARDEIEILYVYSDAAQSAYKRKLRPGIELMINDAKNRKFDYLYVHKIDRLARRIKSAIEIVEELERCSVSLIAVEQNFDLRTPEGKLMFNFLVSLSEFYSDNLSTETRKGKLERSRSGLPNGVVPWGYVSEKIDGKKKAILVPEQGEVIREIFEMYSTGAYTDGEIADWMNSQQLLTKHERGFSKDTIREMMQNVFYTGNVLYRGSREKFKGTSYRNEEGVLSKGLHQPAVDDDLFRKCQLVRKSKNNSNKSKQITQKVYLLRGIVKCDCCERFLRAQSAHNGARYYRETSRIRGFDDCIVNSEVKKSINAKVVEDQIEKIIELFPHSTSINQKIDKNTILI
jgi:site-specific DNA recombinase